MGGGVQGILQPGDDDTDSLSVFASVWDSSEAALHWSSVIIFWLVKNGNDLFPDNLLVNPPHLATGYSQARQDKRDTEPSQRH